MLEDNQTNNPVFLTSEKQKAIERTIFQLENTYGKGVVFRLGENKNIANDAISTGSIGLDLALGGGVPKGRIVEIYGPESSGKTTLALHIIAESQKEGGQCAFIDAEHAFDPVYAGALGVKINDMLISQPDTGEEALEITDILVRSGAIDVVVIDSVAALVPRAELEGGMGEAHMGLNARLMSQALRKLIGNIAKTKCVVIFINQLREKIGILYGNPEVTTGGHALKFYTSVRIDIRRIDVIKNGEEFVGNHIRAKVVKNKLAPPFRKAEFDIIFGEGISRPGELVDLGVAFGILQKFGSWYTLENERIGQGREAVKLYISGHPDTANTLEVNIRNKFIEQNNQERTLIDINEPTKSEE